MAYLGSGNLTLQNTANDFRPGTLWYTGPTASSSKNITVGVGGGHIYVYTLEANLTLSGVISEPPVSPGQSLQVSGAFSAPSTLTLTGNNTFTGPVIVQYLGVLSIGAIANGGIPSPLGARPAHRQSDSRWRSRLWNGHASIHRPDRHHGPRRDVRLLFRYGRGHRSGGEPHIYRPVHRDRRAFQDRPGHADAGRRDQHLCRRHVRQCRMAQSRLGNCDPGGR